VKILCGLFFKFSREPILFSNTVQRESSQLTFLPSYYNNMHTNDVTELNQSANAESLYRLATTIFDRSWIVCLRDLMAETAEDDRGRSMTVCLNSIPNIL
jgi:hypothetical protein